YRHIVVQRLGVLAELIRDYRLHPGADSETAVAFGKMHPRESVVVLLAAKGELINAIGMRFLEQCTHALANIFFGDLGHGSFLAIEFSYHSCRVEKAVELQNATVLPFARLSCRTILPHLQPGAFF